jgi:(p)ppGpp synthase/HD superfamily hydrolase
MDSVREGNQSGLSGLFEEALIYATRLHSNQRRKWESTPYISHLLGVASLVLEDGGDEQEAIAALLHDAVEDQGGLETLAEIRQRFGDRVAGIVAACSDSFTDPKPPWRQRKEAYIARMRSAGPDVRRVSMADKLHNGRATLATLFKEGEETWARFRGGKEGTLWYYRALADVFLQGNEDFMALELARVVERLEADALRSGPG